MSAAIRLLLQSMGEDLEDENTTGTPERVAKFLAEYVNSGTTLEEVLQPRFHEAHNELVIVSNITFTSLCAHHMLPFSGVAHVGYVPNGEVVGISKIPRAFHLIAKRLTLQERVTQQFADGFMDVMKPRGVMVVVEASHDCMGIRGVLQPDARTITSAVRGVFESDDRGIKQEFMSLIRGGR